jgi:rhodanese-related sulfurtransferase
MLTARDKDLIMHMKRSIKIALLTAVATVGSAFAQQTAPTGQNHASAPASKARILKRAELDSLLAQPNPVLLIDVRRPDEVSTIGGFPVYLSIQLSELEKYWRQIPKDRQIVAVSNHAGRAGKAADLLETKGLKVIGAVGAQLYEQEGGTLVKGKPVSAAPSASSGAAQ